MRSGLFPIDDEPFWVAEKAFNALLKSVNEVSTPFGINCSHIGSYSERVESSM